MAYVIWVVIFIILMLMYFIYKSYIVQLIVHKYRVRNVFLNDFRKSTKGRFISSAYFAPSHKIISVKEYQSLPNKQKMNFSKCYNVIIFRTVGIEWELYFNLIKEGSSFTEVMNLRAFPVNYPIRSQGNIERAHSRVNVFTNNHYLTQILEVDVSSHVAWLMRYDGDMLLISPSNLHFKAFTDSKKMSVGRVMDMVKAVNGIKHGIYKKDVIEY